MQKGLRNDDRDKKLVFNRYLVGGLNPSEEYDIVSWDSIILNIWKNNPNVPDHQPGIKIAVHHLPVRSAVRVRTEA